eukprot:SAG22_NODE_6_length_41368_cov_49.702222_21_plen_152_part_00
MSYRRAEVNHPDGPAMHRNEIEHQMLSTTESFLDDVPEDVRIEIRCTGATGTPKTCRLSVPSDSTIAALIEAVISKEKLQGCAPRNFRLVRCDSPSKYSCLPRAGVIDVLNRTVAEYGIFDMSTLAMQDVTGYKHESLRGTKNQSSAAFAM